MYKDSATRLHADSKPKVPLIVGSKQASFPCKKKISAIASPSMSDKSIQSQVENVLLDLRLQNDVVPSSDEMSTCTTPSNVVCEELLDRGAEIKSTNISHEVQVEGIANIDGSTKTIGVSLPLEVGKVGCSTATFAGQCSHEEFMNKSAHALAGPNIHVQVVHQTPCENESHIAKLSASENKSKLCDPTKCDIKSIHNESERYTPHKKRELYCKMCEDVYESNPLIPTSSVVFQCVQICKDIEQGMFAHHTTPLDQRSEKIADVQN